VLDVIEVPIKMEGDAVEGGSVAGASKRKSRRGMGMNRWSVMVNGRRRQRDRQNVVMYWRGRSSPSSGHMSTEPTRSRNVSTWPTRSREWLGWLGEGHGRQARKTASGRQRVERRVEEAQRRRTFHWLGFDTMIVEAGLKGHLIK
jgi:hypothetical protein